MKLFLVVAALLGLAILSFVFLASPEIQTPAKQAPPSNEEQKATFQKDTRIPFVPADRLELANDQISQEKQRDFVSQINAYMEKQLPNFAQAYSRVGPTEYSLFGREEALGLVEGRLLAKLDPNTLEKSASTISFDLTRPFVERAFGIWLLSTLAKAGHPSSDSLLAQLLQAGDPAIQQLSSYALLFADKTNSHNSQFMELAKRRDPAAFKALSRTNSPAAAALMRELSTIDQRNSTIDSPAASALSRIELLQQPDWDQKVAEYLKHQLGQEESEWSLSIARASRLPSFVRILRVRLSESLMAMRKLYDREKAVDQKEGFGDERRTFEEFYVTHTRRGEALDAAYDEALLTFYELGGSLTELEQRRLQHFGYYGDPETRLSQMRSASQGTR